MADPLQAVLSKLQGVRKRGQDWIARCPCHQDANPSLSISQRDGRILLHDFGGCRTEDVVAALGLTLADLFLDALPKTEAREIVATYDYRDAQGRLLFQVVRFWPKGFAQRRPDPDFVAGDWEDEGTRWIWDLKGVQRVLYRLPKVLEAAARGQRVFVVEGEEDVHSVESLGFTATTSPGGAGKWLKSYSEALRGAHVAILPDNDAPGRKHAEKVAASLQGVAASVKVVELPGLPEGGDVSDWLAAGHSREELESLVERAPEWAPRSPVPSGFPATDLGNAERLIAAHGQRLRFAVHLGRWHVWTGKVWAADEVGEVHRLMRQVVRGIAREAEAAQDLEQREALFRHALRSEAAARLTAAIELARFERGIPVTSAELDCDRWLLNCLNGTLDLRTGELREHRPEDLITRLAPVAYEPTAPCPRWDAFLCEVLPDEETIAFVQRIAGLCLTGDTSQHACFFLVGRSFNGKGTLVDTLLSVLGDYGAETPFATFLETRDNVTADLAALAGVRLVKASEGAVGQRFNEPLLKLVTGEDQLTVRHLYHEFFTYRPAFKVLLLTNEVPYLSQSRAVRDRLHVVRFPRTFYAPEEGKQPVRDLRLRETLRQELSGVLNWALAGLSAYQQQGLAPPASVRQETIGLFESLDPLGDFLDQECVLHPRTLVDTGKLWRAYRDWCEREGRPPAFKAPEWFTRNLAQRDGIEVIRRHDGRYLTGLGLRSEQAGLGLEADPTNKQALAWACRHVSPEWLFA